MSRYKLLRILANQFSIENIRKILDFLRHYVSGLGHRIDDHHLFLSGAGIAYSLIISIIPFTLIVFSVLGNILEVSEIEEQISLVIENIIPYKEYAEYTKTFILSRVPEVVQYKTIAGYVGIFGLLFTSTWLFSSLRTILNRVFGVTEHKSAWIGLMRDFGMVFLILAFILIATFILPTINFLGDLAESVEFFKIFQRTVLMDYLFDLISIAIMFLMFFVFYSFIPYEKLGFKVPLVSALWATIFWMVARNLFGYYVSEFLVSNKIYGAFIFVAVVVFWIFYSSCLFILGAEIGQLYRERVSSGNLVARSDEIIDNN